METAKLMPGRRGIKTNRWYDSRLPKWFDERVLNRALVATLFLSVKRSDKTKNQYRDSSDLHSVSGAGPGFLYDKWLADIVKFVSTQQEKTRYLHIRSMNLRSF